MLDDFKSGNRRLNESILANLIKCWTGYILYIFNVRTEQNLVNQSKRKLKVEFLNAVRKKSSNRGIIATKHASLFQSWVISPKREGHTLGEVVVSAFQWSLLKGKWHIKLVTCTCN